MCVSYTCDMPDWAFVLKRNHDLVVDPLGTIVIKLGWRLSIYDRQEQVKFDILMPCRIPWSSADQDMTVGQGPEPFSMEM